MTTPILTRHGALLATTMLSWGVPAVSQDAPPVVITPPTSYSLPPSTPTPSATPTPTAAPTPVVVAPPVVRTAPVLSPIPTPAPRRSPRALTSPTPTPAPTPAERPAAVAPLPTSPQPAPSPTPAQPVVSSPEPAGQGGGWWPWLAGLVAIALAAGGALVWRRPMRSGDRIDTEPSALPLGDPPRQPSPPAQLSSATPTVAPAPFTPVAPAGFTVDFVPLVAATDDRRLLIEFELVMMNGGKGIVDALRPVLGLTTARADLDEQVAAFHGAASLAEPVGTFRLAPGERQAIRGQLELPREAMHVAMAGDRPMTVPVALVSLRWRAGLSVRGAIDAHMVGTGDGGAKLGPLWLDRGPRRYDRLATRRFAPAA